MQGHGASLVFLRASGEVISEDHEEDGNEAKQMGKAYTTMMLALYTGTLLV